MIYVDHEVSMGCRVSVQGVQCCLFREQDVATIK